MCLRSSSRAMHLVQSRGRYEVNMEMILRGDLPGGRVSKKLAKRARMWGSVYEQPALSETTASFLAALGPT